MYPWRRPQPFPLGSISELLVFIFWASSSWEKKQIEKPKNNNQLIVYIIKKTQVQALINIWKKKIFPSHWLEDNKELTLPIGFALSKLVATSIFETIRKIKY